MTGGDLLGVHFEKQTLAIIRRGETIDGQVAKKKHLAGRNRLARCFSINQEEL